MIVSRRFPESTASIRLARQFVAEHLEHADPDSRSAAVAAVSELATNSLRHASSEFTVTVDVDADQIRIEVTDTGPGTPVRRNPSLADHGGRGLNILEALTDRWGIGAGPDSKTVWFTIASIGSTSDRSIGSSLAATST